MNTILTDSMARDHVETLQAIAESNRRAQQARAARRAQRAARRAASEGEHHRVGHAVARPFSVARSWLVAGQL